MEVSKSFGNLINEMKENFFFHSEFDYSSKGTFGTLICEIQC